MKKGLIGAVACMLVCALVGCSQSAPKPTESSGDVTKTVVDEVSDATEEAVAKDDGEPKLIACTVPDLSIQIWKTIADGQKEYVLSQYPDWSYEIVGANGSPATQIEQIENFIAMEADVIFVIPQEATAIVDVCKKAMDAGIPVYTFTQDPGPDARSSYRGANQTMVGEAIAQAAANWIDETYPDAEDGSVPVAIFYSSDSQETTERSDALSAVTDFTSKANIVKVVDPGAKDRASAMSACENLFMTNPEVRAFVCYNGDMAMGVNEYIMSDASRVTDYAEFGAFGSDTATEMCDAIQLSESDGSIVRATVAVGGTMDQTFGGVGSQIILMATGQDYEAENLVDLPIVTFDNVKDFMRP